MNGTPLKAPIDIVCSSLGLVDNVDNSIAELSRNLTYCNIERQNHSIPFLSVQSQ